LSNFPEIRDRPVKRPFFLRCLIVLLALALASGNAHAALHLDTAHREPCPEQHAHHRGKTEPQHQYRHDKGLACCCDCLGCSAAGYLSPPLTVTPADLAARVHYDALTASLSGRALRPDPGPPRPGTPS
jgi:hypothetical protein